MAGTITKKYFFKIAKTFGIKKAIKVDINKFSFAQMTSNSNGKTSGSGTMGVVSISTGMFTFIIGAVSYIWSSDATIMAQSLILIGMGSGLLGYRKSKGGSEPVITNQADEPDFTDEGPLNS